MIFDRAINTRLQFSVVAGRVSTEDHDRILETLDSLRRQEGEFSYEVLLADRLNDDISTHIKRDYNEVTLIDCEAGTDLPTMRTIALKRAVGQFVIVTEDHCVPANDWLHAISDLFVANPSADVIGGCVLNGVDDTALDWATFLCEYSAFLPPVAEGCTSDLPGMNVAYRRRLFDDVPDEVLTSGFWETTLHPRLVNSGRQFISSNRIRIYHCKAFSLGLFIRQRFVYSRYFAGIRFPQAAFGRKLLACTACAALPFLLIFRYLRNIKRQQGWSGPMLRATPYILLFYLIWAIGEAVGYLLGPSDALKRIE